MTNTSFPLSTLCFTLFLTLVTFSFTLNISSGSDIERTQTFELHREGIKRRTTHGYWKYQWCKNVKIYFCFYRRSSLADCQRFRHLESNLLFSHLASGQRRLVLSNSESSIVEGNYYYFLKEQIKRL